MSFRIDDSGVGKQLRSIREAVGAQRADFRPNRLKVVDEVIAANEVEALFNPIGLLESKGRPVFAYIRDHTEKKLSEWGGPDGMKKLHFTVCKTLVGMKVQGRSERLRVTSTTSGEYTVDVGADLASSRGGDVREDVRLYPCKNCLRKVNYHCYQSASNEARTDIVRGFNSREAMDLLWQWFDLFRREVSDLKSAHSPTRRADNWRQTSRAFRRLKHWQCEGCGVDLSHAEHLLHVHHVDGDKRNDRDDNLRCLCKECHSKEPNHHYVGLSEEDLQTINRARGQIF